MRHAAFLAPFAGTCLIFTASLAPLRAAGGRVRKRFDPIGLDLLSVPVGAAEVQSLSAWAKLLVMSGWKVV